MKKITHIDASQLALLINTGKNNHKRVEDCKKMFQIVESRLYDKSLADPPPIVINVDDFEEIYPNYPIRIAINSFKNYLKPGATRRWIMNYPQMKIDQAKGVIKQISIPKAIRPFLTKDQVEEIHFEWSRRYASLEIEFK